MLVLHITPNFWPTVTGGTERFILELATLGKGLGIRSRVLSFDRRRGQGPRLPQRARVQGLFVRRVPFLDFTYYKPGWLPLAELSKADILHVHGVGASLDLLWATQRLHHKPIVLSTHGGIFHTVHNLPLKVLKRWYFSGIQPRVLGAVARVVASSRSDFEMFRPVARRLVLLENGVNVRRFRALRGAKDPRRFLAVARLTQNKRLEDLIRAYASLPDARQAQLRIVGPDWDGIADRLRGVAASCGVARSVSILGAIPEQQLLEEYDRAAFFVSASAKEGFGMSLAEAMAAGCIPLVSDIPAFREIVDDARLGLLLNYAQPRETAGAIQRFRGGDLAAAQELARRRSEEFSWERRLPQWRELYEQVLDESRQARP